MHFQMRSVNSVQQHLANVLKMLTKLKDRLTRITLPGATLSAKLQHAQALLASNLNKHFRAAADQLVHETEQQIDNYIEYVRMQVSCFDKNLFSQAMNFHEASESKSI